MTTSATHHEIPKLDNAISRILNKSNDKWAKRFLIDVPFLLSYLTELNERDYIWNFSSTNYLLKKMTDEALRNTAVDNINRIYFSDIYESISAVREIFNRRSRPLFCSSIRALNELDIISCASTARSAFELSMWSLYHTGMIKSQIAEVCDHADGRNKIIGVSDLQSLIVKLIFGTKLGDDPQDERNQLNITKHCFKPLAAHIHSKTGEKYIEQTYDILCELVHPNQVGNFLFINGELEDVEALQNIPFTSIQVGKSANMSILAICGALSWASQAVMIMNQNIDHSLKNLEKRFEIGNLRLH